jgi:hypothetical protein
MARDGNGTYSVPNTFLPNTVMSASAVNGNFTDAGSELTGSLARDGQSSMSGQFKATAGSVGAPGISWGSDANTGFRWVTADEMRWVAGSADRFYIDSVGKAWALGAFDVAGALNIGGALSGAGVPDLAAIEALSGNGLLKRTGAATWALDTITTSLQFTINNSGSVLETGILGDIVAPYAMVITSVTLLADTSGACVVDIWKDTYANYPPTDADTITAAAPPTIAASGVKSVDSTLTGWTTTVTAGDTLRFNLDSVTAITRLTVIITGTRFA